MTQRNERQTAVTAAYAVGMGLLLGALVMGLFGYNPVVGYEALLTSALGSWRSFGAVLTQMAPIILTGLGFTVASKAGFFNIGLAGQALAGWVTSVWVALAFSQWPSVILLPAALLAGVVMGALIGGLAGWLRAQFGTSEVIVTIMMNYILVFVGNYLLQNVMAPGIKDSVEATKMVRPGASLQVAWLTRLTDGSNVSLGIGLALVMVVVIGLLMTRTTLGFELKVAGLNPDAARYAGMSARRLAVTAMALSGGLAGLAGVVEGLGNYQNLTTQTVAPAIGFDGMAVALLGAGTYSGLVLAALLFSVLKVGGLGMPMMTGVPFELVDMIIAMIIFFVGAQYVITCLREWLRRLDREPATAKEPTQ